MKIYKPDGKFYWLDVRDHLNTRRRFSLMTSDRRIAESFADTVQGLIAASFGNKEPAPELQAELMHLPAKLRKRLGAWGIVEPQRGGVSKTLSEHAADYCDYMIHKGITPHHANHTHTRITQILNGCKMTTWVDISESDILRFLADRRASGKINGTTANHYIKAIKGFLKWSVYDKRAYSNTLAGTKRIDDRTEQKRQRRPLTADELRKLIANTKTAETMRGVSGAERAFIYKFAAETGLRANEIRLLKVNDFDLNAKTVSILRQNSKSRKAAVLPLRKDTAAILKERLANKTPQAAAFNFPKSQHQCKLFKADLKAVGIPYKDDAGRVADFHALRGTAASLLAASGVHPKVAQSIMRHSDINLTMQVYTHLYAGAEAQAVEGLPDLLMPIQQIKTGTDDMPLDAVAMAEKKPAANPDKSCATAILGWTPVDTKTPLTQAKTAFATTAFDTIRPLRPLPQRPTERNLHGPPLSFPAKPFKERL